VECKGIWFGEDCATEWLCLNFQPDIPSNDVPALWMQTLLRFKNGNPHEDVTIFDRLPLDNVRPDTFDVTDK
jgi:hypothetical protein